jgi:RNA methyltransferase, TrmH family
MDAFKIITSIKDDLILEARKLNTASGRNASQKSLLEGSEIIGWALESGWDIERVFFDPKLSTHPFITRLIENKIDLFSTSEGILKKVSDTNYLIPFIGVAKIPLEQNFSPRDFILLLDEVKDHGNIGTIIRTASAFGIRDVATTDRETDILYKKVIEASRGTVFKIRNHKYSNGEEALKDLRRMGYQIIATSPHAESLQSFTNLKSQPVALVVGNETSGISPSILEKADFVVQIPMSRDIESLNVGVATGISIYEFKLKLVLQMLTKYIRETLGREINVTGKMIQLALDVRLKTLSSFNSTQIILLMVMKCDEKMTLGDISRDTALFGDELDRMLYPLLKDGYVQKEEESIRLTEKGEQMLSQFWGVIEASESEVIQGFSDLEKEQFFSYLKRIQSNCHQLLDSVRKEKL